MGRGGLTYIDVSKTADKLRNKGIIPTIDKIREVLGTGSKTTIAHHLKRWKESTVEDLEYQSLPIELAKAVKDLYEQLQAQASQKIAELEAKSQKEIDQLLQQLKQERENVGVLKRNILNLEGNNNKLATQVTALENMVAELKQINTCVVADQNALTTKIQGKIKQIATLKEQLKSIELNGEHYREMLKQQRDEEKLQFAHQLEALQQENKILKTKSIEANSQINTIKQENFALQSKVQHFEKLHTDKITASDLLSNRLLLAAEKQEALLNNLIKRENHAARITKSRQEIAV